jgi:hypothetical protein
MSKGNIIGFGLMIIPIVIALVINEWKSLFDLSLIYRIGICFVLIVSYFEGLYIGVLQTNGIITQDLGSGLIWISGFCFFGSMFCLIA